MNTPNLLDRGKFGCIQRLAERNDVLKVTGDMCRHGMLSADDVGEGLVKKPTSFLGTNSTEIANTLALRCDNDKQAIGVWRRTDRGLQFGVGPGAKGPSRSQVVRRITLDLTNQVVLQDLKDANKRISIGNGGLQSPRLVDVLRQCSTM